MSANNCETEELAELNGKNCDTFRILVSVPNQAPPEEGYGIIYAIDAGWTFGTLRESALLQASRFAESGVKPTIIVGIGWPDDTLIDMERRGPDLVGDNRAQTLDFLTGPLRDRVEGDLPVDPRHRMLLGHSFGGAFVLRTALSAPDAFSSYAAGSPSIWTDPEWFFDRETDPANSLLVTIGSLEDPDAEGAAEQPADRLERLRARRMFGNAQDFAKQNGGEFTVFEGLSHGASATPFLARAVSFLWTGPRCHENCP
ncbi:alpha/beta hydrolase [Celeribacter sp. ULVN23_4]